MKQVLLTVKENTPLTENVYKMTLCGDCSDITASGQFVNIKLDGLFLRRPISVCDKDGDTLTIIYKVVGNGTQQMSILQAGEQLDLLTGLGNGYDLNTIGKKPLLIGGGAGVPPMYLLAKRLIKKGVTPQVILGFNTEAEVFFAEEFRSLGVKVYITTVDGTHGTAGFVTDAFTHCEAFDYTCACGPEPMLKAVYEKSDVDGQFSFEERMGCGFGACMGCSCKTKYGYKRICREGPILFKEEIVW